MRVAPTPPYADLNARERRSRLAELALVFLKLGTTAFGGPAAHIAMMEQEFVQRRKWLDRQRFLDMIGTANLIPGPSSTEVAIHVGLERAGLMGLLLAGTCFILPAMAMVWVIAAIYARYQALPQAQWLLWGIKPVIIAIVAQALWNLGKSALKNVPTWAAAAGVLVLARLGLHPVLLLALAGLLVMLARNVRQAPKAPMLSVAPVAVFWVFLRIGAVLYGSGYVLLAFLQKELVERTHWLGSQQLLDAIAIGQFTPGPVFTTATFIGYLLAGNAGALAATLGIFLPAFVLIALIQPLAGRIRKSPWASAFLDGVNAAALALMAAVAWELGRAALVDWPTVIIALVSLGVLMRFKLNSAWLVLAGGAIGLVASLCH